MYSDFTIIPLLPVRICCVSNRAIVCHYYRSRDGPNLKEG